MTRRPVLTSLAALGLAALAGCVVNISFALQRTVAVQSPAATPNNFETVQAVNLLDSKDVADHQANVKSLDLEYLDATITTVNPGNRATKISGAVKLRKTAADTTHDVVVGTLTDFAITQGARAHFPGSAALDQFLLDAVHGDGKFLVVIAAQVDGAADVVLGLDLHMGVGYDAGIL